MAEIVKKGTQIFWLDPQKNEIPYSYVRDEDRKRDKVANQVMTRVKRINKLIAKEKAEIQKLIGNYLQELAESYGENWKGNATIKDFSDTIRIDVKVSDRITFDEKLQIAKQKVDECIKTWASGSSQKIKLLVDRAFKTDKQGKLNNKMLLGLRQLKINDDLWKEAMEILSDSISIVDSTEYYRFYRKDEKGKERAIEVNFSAMDTSNHSEGR